MLKKDMLRPWTSHSLSSHFKVCLCCIGSCLAGYAKHHEADINEFWCFCRLVRHKNVVQFIGACSCWPRLCIVTELMSGGRYALQS
jgi:hypothetical protein